MHMVVSKETPAQSCPSSGSLTDYQCRLCHSLKKPAECPVLDILILAWDTDWPPEKPEVSQAFS